MNIRLWSKKIVNIISNYSNKPGLYLFGITGDLDNLGIFVSENGRATAENLVEAYNHIIGQYLYKFVVTHNEIEDFTLIPSGEEIFALGIARNQDIVNTFFKSISNDVNHLLKSNSPIEAPYVTISFGCKIFDSINGKELIEATSNDDITTGNKLFLDLMKQLREQLAFELDKAKFASLGAESLSILLRNCVYSKMREYKATTKEQLTRLISTAKQDDSMYKRLENNTLNKHYGIHATQGDKLLKLLAGDLDVID